VRRSEWPQDADSNRAKLAAKLAACRTPKGGFNAAQGDFSDALQLCPRCPVGGLNAKACHYRRQVTGKVCGLDFCREFAFRLRLFANAGFVEPKPTAAVSPEHYDKTFDINARGIFFAVQKALPLMKDGGSIILTGSGVWQKGIPIYATYGATKAALRSFVRTWTAELAGKGIRANMISPGPTETPILKGQFGENTDAMKERFKTMIPMGRMGKPEEIASAAVFLASDESSYISGIDLPVDGGLVAV
jgi:NAD(P)-dependent dehydrogenase (short-subunit alcohol dehydrogenase family)